jgi:hypothetical protein
MLERGTGVSRATPAALQTLEERLEVVPLDVLRALDANDTALVFLKPGEEPMDVIPERIVNPLDSRTFLDELASVNLEGCFAETQARYAPVLQKLPPGPSRKMVETQLHGETQNALAARSGGRVRLFVSPHGDVPVTLEGLAGQAGASTPEQVQHYARLVEEMNGPRLADARSAALLGPEGMQLGEFFAQLPSEQQPLLASGRIMVPEARFFQGQLIATKEFEFLTQTDGWAGYYHSDINTAFIRENQLGYTTDGTCVPVHELGHAYADALSDRAPELYQPLKSARDETFVRLQTAPTFQFPTSYSAENPSEFVAESFALLVGGQRERVWKSDDNWARAMEEAIAKAPQVANRAV